MPKTQNFPKRKFSVSLKERYIIIIIIIIIIVIIIIIIVIIIIIIIIIIMIICNIYNNKNPSFSVVQFSALI